MVLTSRWSRRLLFRVPRRPRTGLTLDRVAEEEWLVEGCLEVEGSRDKAVDYLPGISWSWQREETSGMSRRGSEDVRLGELAEKTRKLAEAGGRTSVQTLGQVGLLPSLQVPGCQRWDREKVSGRGVEGAEGSGQETRVREHDGEDPPYVEAGS
jgi:hypothetical protein